MEIRSAFFAKVVAGEFSVESNARSVLPNGAFVALKHDHIVGFLIVFSTDAAGDVSIVFRDGFLRLRGIRKGRRRMGRF